MKNKDGIYFEIFAVKDGVRYNSRIISINDVSEIMTNSLMDGLQEITMPKESEDTE